MIGRIYIIYIENGMMLSNYVCVALKNRVLQNSVLINTRILLPIMLVYKRQQPRLWSIS